MKFVIIVFILIFYHSSSIAQEEVLQDKNGGIYYVYSEQGVKDSIKMVNSRSQKLASFKIGEDEVLVILKSFTK